MRLFLLVLSALSLTALTGCAEILGDPSYVPAGYTYHGDKYKAPPGPKVAPHDPDIHTH